MQQSHLQINGNSIAVYESSGSGTAILLIHGAEDQIVNVDYIRSLKMPTLWRDEVQVIEGAGHAPHWEQQERFNILISDFVADVTQSAQEDQD